MKKKILIPSKMFDELKSQEIFCYKTIRVGTGYELHVQEYVDDKVELSDDLVNLLGYDPQYVLKYKQKSQVMVMFEGDEEATKREIVLELEHKRNSDTFKNIVPYAFKELSEIYQLISTEFKGTEDIHQRIEEFKEFAKNIITDCRRPGKQSGDDYFKSKIKIFKDKTKETIAVYHLEEKLQFSNYQNTFINARKMGRKIKLFVGPTNSGKTYGAFQELKKVKTGAYLAPLRLLAHEGQDKLFEMGILSNLLTGEERQIIKGATHVCSTIEMAQLAEPYDCVVIDEIQMLNDSQRGWAWTQAIVGCCAKELILVGSPEILPKLLPLLNDLKEEYEIQHFERKNELKVVESLNSDYTQLQKGDCLVVFNRKDALGYKRKLTEFGLNCSVVYGNLSPEVRVTEARRFNSGATDILIATDAIGMGLNLPIKKIYFSKIEKFNGIETKLIEPSLVKQIAGRAGRFGHGTEAGEVSTLHEADLDYLSTCINLAYPKSYEDNRSYIQPNISHIKEISQAVKTDKIAPILIFFKEKMVSNSKLFRPSHLDDMIYLAQHIDRFKLSIEDAYLYCCSPIDVKHEDNFKIFLSWVNKFSNKEAIDTPKIPSGVNKNIVNDFNLFEAESYVKTANLYRWLHYHWPEEFFDIDLTVKNIDKASSYIEAVLSDRSEKIGLHDQRRKRRR